MANCEELACARAQSAICLHCLHHLCSMHILAHRTLLSKESDGLCEEINELTDQVNVCLQQIRTAREEATHELNIWRKNQIDEIENNYTKKTQVIESRKNHLTKFEDEFIQRLTKEAKEPLEHIQAQQSFSRQNLQTVRQAIANITRDNIQLELCLKDSPSPSSSSSTLNPAKSEQQYLSNIPQTTFTVASTTTSNSFSNETATMQTIVTPSSASKPKVTNASPHGISSPSSKVPTNSDKTLSITKRCSLGAHKKLTALFKDISHSSDPEIEEYIIRKLNQATNNNNMVILLLSFLKAWHYRKSVTVYRHNVLHYHINHVKKYIKSEKQKVIVVCVIQEFVDSCNCDETKSSEILTDLLKFFLYHQCITKENILNWYKNGASYGYNGFEKAKLWAESFVDELNNNIQSKQTLISKPSIIDEL